MTRLFVGTSSLAADQFYLDGEPVRVNCTASEALALRCAREIARDDGGHPVVLSFDMGIEVAATSSFVPLHILPEEMEVSTVEFLDTPRARLGLPETAGIGDLINGLTEAMRVAQDVVKFGAGEGSVNLALNVHKSAKDKAAKKAAAKKPPGPNARKQRQKLVRPGVKSAKIPKGAKAPGKSTKARKPRQATPPVGPTQGGRPAKTLKTKHGGVKTATKAVTLSGTINGKAAKATLKPGSKYKAVRGPGGLTLHRKGQKPFVVAPVDAGKV